MDHWQMKLFELLTIRCLVFFWHTHVCRQETQYLVHYAQVNKTNINIIILRRKPVAIDGVYSNNTLKPTCFYNK